MKAWGLKIITAGAAAMLVGIVMAAAGSSMPMRASVDIRHAAVGCHKWSVNSGSYAAHRTLAIFAGQSVTFTNHDKCGILLKQTTGPDEAMVGGKVLYPFGKPLAVTLGTPGMYTFTGTDYDAVDLVEPDLGVPAKGGIGWFFQQPSTGQDNVLTLTVRVHPSSNLVE